MCQMEQELFETVHCMIFIIAQLTVDKSYIK
jgi:hypothetical protein